jgi:hypothetical protein
MEEKLFFKHGSSVLSHINEDCFDKFQLCGTLPSKKFQSELLGFWILSIVRNSKYTRKHNVSETGSVSAFR